MEFHGTTDSVPHAGRDSNTEWTVMDLMDWMDC